MEPYRSLELSLFYEINRSSSSCIRTFVIAAIIMIMASASTARCGSEFAKNVTPNSGLTMSGGVPPYENPRLPVDVRVKDLLGRMTLQEKARQLDMYAGHKCFVNLYERVPYNRTHVKADAVLDSSRAQKELGNLGVGAIHDLYPSASLYNSIQRWVIHSNRLGIPALFVEEGLHGYLGFGQTVFPQSVNLASTWNTRLAREEGAAIGAEARADGIDMLLAPVINLALDPRWGRVEETFGEDPFLSGRMAVSYIEGMQGHSLATDSTCISEPKHFAGYGAPESGLNTVFVNAGMREIRSLFLQPFKAAVMQGHAMAIMAAYNSIDGVPCTGNKWLLTTVLRHEWGFRGFVLSDLGAIHRLYRPFNVAKTPGDAVRLAINSGVDMQFYDFPHDTFQNAIINGVREGKLSMKVLNRAVGRILRVKFMLGLFDHPYVNVNLDKRVRRSPAHLALALKVARESIVLLKNSGDLLPLKKDLKCVAVIGPNADSTRLGDYTTPPDDRINEGMLAQIKKMLSPVTKVLYTNGSDIQAAVRIAREAKVAILGLGENTHISGEGHDRADLGLPGNQEKLLQAVVATGIPVVLVLQNGRPLTIDWANEHVPAIVEAWYPGEFGGKAIAETLFGENNPSGKLVMSFPRKVGQLPVYYEYLRSKDRKYISTPATPLFPFGYGLSYTTFKYSNVEVSQPASDGGKYLRVSFDLSNTGKRPGTEVAQVYVHQDYSDVELPVEELKGFARVHLVAGQTKSVSIRVKRSDLAVWSADQKWEVQPGMYKIIVGGSSQGGTTVHAELK